MENTKVYVVMGTTGEYSDRSEWPVKAFFEEHKAKELVKLATKSAKECEATRESRYTSEGCDNPYDPDMYMDYTGTMYFIMEVDLEVGNPVIH